LRAFPELVAWGRSQRSAARVLALLVGGLFLTGPASAQVREIRRVLIFNELGLWSPGVAAIDNEVYSALSKSPYQIEFYTEDLDSSLFPNAATQKEFRDWYFRKYQNRKLDLIIAVGPSAIAFMSESHRTFSPGTPIVFWSSTDEFAEPPTLDADFTGVWGVAQPDKTLDAALRLRPDTEHVFVVGGVAPYDRHLEALVKGRFRRYESKVDFTYLTELAMPELLEQLGHLPNHSIVYHTSIMQDAKGTHFIDASQAVPMVATAANAPVFAVDDVDVGKGTVGGDVFSFSLAGRVIADMASRILNGEKPKDIPIVKGANTYMFDWRALERWGLRESDLPAGSVVLNRPPTLWESYKFYIIGGVSLILIEALLIGGLLWNRARRRKAETELARSFEIVRESEERFRLVSNTAPVMIWMAGPDKLCTYFNQPWLEFTGRVVEKELGNGWSEGVHPDDLAVCLEIYGGSFARREPFQMQYRLRRNDGEYRWVLDIGVPRFNSDGSFAGYIGSAIDITDRKQAEAAMSGLSRKLIEAQEAERRRIARELHDDINQRIALLAVNLQTIKSDLPAADARASQQLQESWERVLDIGNDVQALSHRLHSSRLEFLGLEVACAGFCREFSKQQDVKIELAFNDVPKSIPSEVSLCLFRVLQEALHNAAKYSGVNQFEVSLTGQPNEIQLRVHDSGVGFDSTQISNGEGLGLISMMERAKLVGGNLSIESEPGHGTTIVASVRLGDRAAPPEASAYSSIRSAS